MEEISSYEIHLKEELQTKDVMEIHQFSLKGENNIYLYRENVIADARNLPKLLSFFFITPKSNSIVMIIDGVNTKESYEDIISILDDQAKNTVLRVNHQLQSNESIVV
ncbi:hypothetical protein CIL05_14320 [Virgibacillus profundi]|uniref:Uncharacterized protein n=1 Tax=Virgibacillus profundi TaxID=2024555 RepID=A0A2A2IAP2_9BACI|nr:hypothetical protein [Virgibacillus profundi]PAV28799.1 hypothetical protein CIL05_14320 [Virgibacillus profundi]PXY52967.1 hypothetical protein CIT14_14445 [Virgibacillus profundi]